MVDTWEETVMEWQEKEPSRVEEMASDPAYLSGHLDKAFLPLWDRDPERAVEVLEKMIYKFAELYADWANLPPEYVRPLAEFYKVYYAVRLMDKYGIEEPFDRWVAGRRDLSEFYAGVMIFQLTFREIVDTRRIEKYWSEFRRGSNWYISMSPNELMYIGALLGKNYREGVSVEQSARDVLSISGRSPKSLYFNLYYLAKSVQQFDYDYGQYLAAVARQVSKLKR